MNLLKRTATAAVLLGALFLVVQYAPDWAFFLFAQAFVAAALLEFYSLALRKDLHPRKVLGVGMTLLVGLSFYFRTVPLEAALFGGLLVAVVTFVVSVNSAEKLGRFPAAF